MLQIDVVILVIGFKVILLDGSALCVLFYKTDNISFIFNIALIPIIK